MNYHLHKQLFVPKYNTNIVEIVETLFLNSQYRNQQASYNLYVVTRSVATIQNEVAVHSIFTTSH
jgi:hypothetical protein